jgi:hypothetical protein
MKRKNALIPIAFPFFNELDLVSPPSMKVDVDCKISDIRFVEVLKITLGELMGLFASSFSTHGETIRGFDMRR